MYSPSAALGRRLPWGVLETAVVWCFLCVLCCRPPRGMLEMAAPQMGPLLRERERSICIHMRSMDEIEFKSKETQAKAFRLLRDKLLGCAQVLHCCTVPCCNVL